MLDISWEYWEIRCGFWEIIRPGFSFGIDFDFYVSKLGGVEWKGFDLSKIS